MSLSISLNEKDVLFVGFLVMIRDKERNPTEYDMALSWMSRPGTRRQRKQISFDEALTSDPMPLDFYSELKDLHSDWIETLTEAILDQYRERQMTNIVRGDK